MKISFCCEDIRNRVANGDIEISVESLTASFLLSGTIPLRFCPWCGKPMVFDTEVVQ